MPGSRLHNFHRTNEAIRDAVWALQALAHRKRPPKVIPRGATLRPGRETPLWLALAATIRPLLRRRGAKFLLASELGLHRGRMTEFFVNGTAMPDAERTLQLLAWYARQRSTRSTPPR